MTQIAAPPREKTPARRDDKTGRRSRESAWRRSVPPLVAFVLFLVLWQGAVVILQIPRYLLPSPADLVLALPEALPRLVQPTLVTMQEAYGGYLIAIVIGFFVAILMARWRVVERGLYPYLVLLQTVPIVATAPLLVVWLGAGTATNTTVAAILAVFAITANVLMGLKSTDRNLIQLYRMAGAGEISTLFTLRIPFAAPYIFTGLRIAAASSVIGAIVSQFTAGMGGGKGGLGYVITETASLLRMPELFLAILAACSVSLILFGIVGLLERLLLRSWHESAIPDEE